MKRSDMIENIASAIILAEIAGTNSPVGKAERILYVIEKAGMLPPERQIDPKVKPGAAGPLKYYVNDWEPDNE